MRPKFFFTFILSLILFIPLQKGFAVSEITKTCLGTLYYPANGVVEKDQLIKMTIIRKDDLSIRYISVFIYGIKNSDEEFSLDENDEQIVASSIYSDKRTLIKFDKKSKQVLMVANFSDGYVSKFLGNCF